jgi:hypothetical protein
MYAGLFLRGKSSPAIVNLKKNKTFLLPSPPQKKTFEVPRKHPAETALSRGNREIGKKYSIVFYTYN